MSKPLNIADLASALVQRASAGMPKVASAEPARAEHPVVAVLKQAADALRREPDIDVSIASVQKIATALPGTTSMGPNAASALNAGKPSVPSLKTTNLGVTAGGGGAGESLKTSSALRKLAQDLREQDVRAEQEETVKAAHVLNAAVGLRHLQGLCGVKDL